ncbi:MAG: deoxyribonuclease IV [Anaeromicrobium sp.]|jgi:deoxyribonuclease-4|uniref:deoxyribonuclease IV n=1 Tax=Anaeromicrobium sp. TaxID=1929132 RepID=UPI0025D19055|nr:deoxyribonuclease IV [Anaeromicrobium sp.]MCT4593003.1 deoxyribonuclease IV [Anaeromicrobium sp.]
MYIGCHLSTSKGFKNMGKVALEIGANTFQFFTRNPRGGKARKLDLKDIEGLKKIMEENDFGPLLAHAPYTLNMCSQKEETREFAKMIFTDDLERLEQLPCSLYNFHPGSHTGQGVDKGIELILEILNDVVKEEHTTTILLEAMAGKGTEVGRSFEELKRIIDGTKYPQKFGVVLDTCHIYSAGYDIVNDLDGVLEKFDEILGLDKLKAIHLNDSKMPFNSNKDRHECIGEGTIGLDGIINLINHPKLKNIPLLLETPNELEGYEREIKLLKDLKK